MHCVPGWGGRAISESWGWVNWIAEHYTDDYDVVYFMHDHVTSWHRRGPPPSTCPVPRGFGSQRMNFPWNSEGYNEMPALTWFAKRALNMTTARMIEEFRLKEHRCCAEACTSMATVRGTPLATWVDIRRSIEHHPGQPWGWVLERLWPILFRLKL
jgi:hypothetical protein